MDEDDRAELRAAHTDNTAIASVAIQGVVGICNELAYARVLSVPQLSRISEFMVASLERSGASEQLQVHLHEAIGHQFSTLVAELAARDSGGSAPER